MRALGEKEFTDVSGDKLILKSYPSVRAVIACEKLEHEDFKAQREAAIEEFEIMKKLGTITDKIIEEIDENSPEVKAAQKAAAESVSQSPAVKRFRLEALAVKLTKGNESFGGKAILEEYDKAHPQDAVWIDAQVKEVWEAAIPSEAEKNSEGADDKMPERKTISATPEQPQPASENS